VSKDLDKLIEQVIAERDVTLNVGDFITTKPLFKGNSISKTTTAFQDFFDEKSSNTVYSIQDLVDLDKDPVDVLEQDDVTVLADKIISAFTQPKKTADPPDNRWLIKKNIVGIVDNKLNIMVQLIMKSKSVELKKPLGKLKQKIVDCSQDGWLPFKGPGATAPNKGMDGWIKEISKHLGLNWTELKNPTAASVATDRSQTLTQPQFYTGTSDVGKFSPEAKLVFDQFFKLNGIAGTGAPAFQAKMKAISDFSTKLLADPTFLINQEVGKVLNSILVLENFYSIVKELDGGAGAYYFEALLALIAEGVVTGKGAVEDEEAVTEVMTADDFTIKGGGNAIGSAKFYQKASGISQAVSGFLDNMEYHYIVGLKRTSKDLKPKATGQGPKGGMAFTSDPYKIVALDIHYMIVKPQGDGKFDIYAAANPNQKIERQVPSGENARVSLDAAINTAEPYGTITLTSPSSQTQLQGFHEYIAKQMDKSNSAIEAALIDTIKAFFSVHQELKEETKLYMGEPTGDNATKVYTKYTSLGTQWAGLKSGIDMAQVKYQRTQQPVSESLDNLIESIIKKKLLK